MGLFNFMKKNKEKSEDGQAVISNSVNVDCGVLIKQATQLKKENNISEAIDLIKRAIQTSPNIPSYGFKLSNYLHSAGRKEEAYAVLVDMKNINSDSLGMANMNYSLIIEKELTLLFKDKKYQEYMKSYFIWLYNRILAHASQENFAKENLLEKMINTKSLLDYLAPKKMCKCLKELGIENIKEDLHNTLFEYFKSKEKDLKKMRSLTNRKIAQTIINNFKFGNPNSILINPKSKFMDYFLEFNSSVYLNYLDEVIMHKTIKNEP